MRFSPFGQITRVNIVTQRGIAFVEFATLEVLSFSFFIEPFSCYLVVTFVFLFFDLRFALMK